MSRTSPFTRLLAVYDGSDNLLMRFEYADDRMPVAVASEEVIYYLAYDQVGSLRVVADAAGNVLKRIDYDSFGNIIADTNEAFEIPFGFTGGLHDRDTGLVRFGFRDYDPDVGRWTAKDPVGLTPISIDLYGYCLNDPINWIDPLGLPFLVGGGGSVVALGGLEASGGIVIDPGSKGRKVDLFGSVGTGVGLNVSADLLAGWIKGDVTGITENINLVLGPVSLTAFFDPATGDILGGTLGLGPSLTPIAGSFTLSATGTLGDLIDWIRDILSEMKNNPCN